MREDHRVFGREAIIARMRLRRSHRGAPTTTTVTPAAAIDHPTLDVAMGLHPEYAAAIAAARAGDPTHALALIDAARGDHDRRWWVLRHLTHGCWRDAHWRDVWTPRGTDDVDVWLARTRMGIREAWDVRGTAPGAAVALAQWRHFQRALDACDADLHEAMLADRFDPLVYELAFERGRGMAMHAGDREALISCAQIAEPHHYGWVQQASRHMSPMWFGDRDEGWQFAWAACEAAPTGARVRLAACDAAHQLVAFDEACEADEAQRADTRERVEQALALADDLTRAPDATVRCHAANWVACLAAAAGMAQRARDAFARVGDWISEDPWVSPAEFSRWRRWADAEGETVPGWAA